LFPLTNQQTSAIIFELTGVYIMPSLLALSLSIGGLGAVATFLALGPLSAILQIWVIFIAWGCFFASGGNAEGMKGAIASHILGAILAAIALILISKVALGPVTAPVWVGLLVGIMVYASTIELFANIPASVYGFASTAGLALLSPMNNPMAADLTNPAIIAIISLIVGSVFGLLSAKLAEMMEAKSE
jgi:hypothetical protein